MSTLPEHKTANAPIKSNPTESKVPASAPEAQNGFTDLTEKAAKLLNPCPESGSGVHRWIYGAACKLTDAGLTAEEAEPIIEGLMSRDPNPPSEITDALQAARGERKAPRSRPPANPALIAEVAKGGPGVLGLIDRSPVKIQLNGKSGTEIYIDALFPGNPLLCAGSKSKFETLPREKWRWKLPSKPHIVPSPMSARQGLTLNGKPSQKSLSNTGPRKFLVIEWDAGGLDLQAALLWHLQKTWPLAMAVFSGGKSLQGWFPVLGESEEKLEKFFDYACALGCDRATWNKSQFVRMPDGFRPLGETSGLLHDTLKDGGRAAPDRRLQSVVFFHPEILR
jgi:hypothetical protein